MARFRFRTFTAGALASGVVAAGLALGASAASADQVVLACSSPTPQTQISTLNPPIHSGDARYYKSVSKGGSGGTCLVDPGIYTNQLGQDPKYVLDDQTNGFTSLDVLSSTTITTGSATCNFVDPANDYLYPTGYPGQGKIITKFVQTLPSGAPIQLQAYIRLGKDLADPDPYDLVASGLVIKGVGVGGNVHAVVSIYPDLTSPKNLNITDCIANPALGNATLAVMTSTPTDGSDADADVDLWTVSLPS